LGALPQQELPQQESQQQSFRRRWHNSFRRSHSRCRSQHESQQDDWQQVVWQVWVQQLSQQSRRRWHSSFSRSHSRCRSQHESQDDWQHVVWHLGAAQHVVWQHRGAWQHVVWQHRGAWQHVVWQHSDRRQRRSRQQLVWQVGWQQVVWQHDSQQLLRRWHNSFRRSHSRCLSQQHDESQQPALPHAGAAAGAATFSAGWPVSQAVVSNKKAAFTRIPPFGFDLAQSRGDWPGTPSHLFASQPAP
jgi:hypothetical protein